MRKLLLLALALVLSFSYAYSWEQFQNNEVNTGKANGTGYFHEGAIKSLNDSLNSMDFEPLVSDVDNNGKNEIIIFSGNYLKLFDNKLSLLDEKFVGNLLGQPTVFNIDNDLFKEIIFISNISGADYFFAYEYNNTNFNHEFNFTVANRGIGAGIKCTGIGNTNACIFMDNAQYIHIVNLSSKTDSSYKTSSYNDTMEKIPAIGDLHGNGSLTAVFWFDKNNDNDYGLLAFDILGRDLDFSFNRSGIADDIVTPYGARFALKGHPVLADLNNDNKLEIAVSVFYDDTPNNAMAQDWFTELFVYNSSGKKLFSKCELNTILNNGCNDASSETSQWEGTNPFVLDSDNNGIDDICFIKDKKSWGYFKNMTISCYNYPGSKILDSEIIPPASTIKTAATADMNGDGVMDIITENNIYYKNGSSFYSHNFGYNFAIPADIDGNGRLDLLLSKSSLTKVFIDELGIIEAKNVSIAPLIPSSGNSLSCSWAITGSGALNANVSWYKNDVLYSTENNIECNNGSVCSVLNSIPSSSISKNDVWKCSVVGFNDSFKSYAVSDKKIIFSKTSEWREYCNSENNLCRQSGASYFSNEGTESIINNSEGIEFEPLVADINNDGKNEIIIFSNSKLIIFNQSLGLINEKNIGILVGQPAIYNIDPDNNLEIIFNANISSDSYLMAFEYNGNFSKQCNISISNGLSGAGIKCADVGTTSSCFFKDQKNVFYNFNMSSCTQKDSLATNNNEDTTPTVPSILDYDNDGKLEGLWWFNNDSDSFMGIAIIELETMEFDTGFNSMGFIDDITQGSGTNYRSGFEHLKANPVFYQSDNNGGYELLISYDNEKITGMSYDEFQCYRSVLKLYDTDGTLLWAKRPTTCEQPATGTYNCDISTPVLADADNDGYDDVCFIMNGDNVCYNNAPDDYFYCLDRFGNNIEGYPKNTSDVNLYGSYSANLDTPLYIADMDNDNELEMIGSGFIWELNGTILKGNYSSFTKYAPIPVDVDKNGILELIGTKADEISIFKPNANICSGRVGVISFDSSNNAVPYTNFYVNDVLEGIADFNGLLETEASGICGKSLSYALKCQNNTISCGTQTKSIDFNNDFDSLIFDCTVCTGNSDLKIFSKSINISNENNKVTVNITIENVIANDINLTVKAQDKDTGLISNENSVLFNVNSGDKFSIQSLSLSLNNADFVHIYADANNSVNEPKENNYAVVPVVTNKRKAFLSVDTGNPYADDAIKEYLSQFIIPASDFDSTLTIAVGLGEHNSIINSKKSFTHFNYGWYADSNSVYFNNMPIGSMPWIGLVGSFKDNALGDDFVFVMGKEIEGVASGAKRLVNGRDKFFAPQSASQSAFNSYTSIIEDTDVLGISVFDLMHNDENKDKFNNQRSPEFKKAVKSILEGNNYEIAIKTVRTVNDNTTLRIKNLKSDFSSGFKDAVVNNTKPIVFSGGLWNNLFYWEENKPLMNKFTGKGRDLWEIEITGGPKQDGTDSPNYSYNDTRDYYWPALIAGVQQYSGENSLQYVGHSNGCGVALASLNAYSDSGKLNAGYYFDSSTGKYLPADLSSNPVDTFVGMGCPGSLDGYSPFYKYFGMFGDKIIAQIKSEHVTAKEVSQKLLALCKSELDGDEEEYCLLAANSLKTAGEDNKVSKKLLIDYLENIKDTNNGPQVDNGLAINRFRVYANRGFTKTYRGGIRFILGGGQFDTTKLEHDIVVSQEDSQKLSDRISATNSIKLINFTNFHHGRNTFKEFMDDLEVFLNDK